MKFKTTMMIVSVFLLFSCESKPQETSQPISEEKTSQIIDNTKASLDHTPIKLYQENNVPFDEDDDTQPYIFLTPYLAPHPSGGAVLVFPGGGYGHLSNSTTSVSGYGQGVDNQGNQKESSSIVPFYNNLGISVFVVNYRTKALGEDVNYHAILADGSRAIRYVKHHASDYYLSKDRIAVQGYSAGGHLAATLATYSFVNDDKTYQPDDIDEEDDKANAAILCYAVTSMEDAYTHNKTRSNFLNAETSLYETFSPYKHVSKDTCPMFLWCHEYDATVSSQNTYLMAKALEDNNVDCVWEVYDDNHNTAHGLGIAADYEEAKTWPSKATAFLKEHEF